MEPDSTTTLPEEEKDTVETILARIEQQVAVSKDVALRGHRVTQDILEGIAETKRDIAEVRRMVIENNAGILEVLAHSLAALDPNTDIRIRTIGAMIAHLHTELTGQRANPAEPSWGSDTRTPMTRKPVALEWDDWLMGVGDEEDYDGVPLK